MRGLWQWRLRWVSVRCVAFGNILAWKPATKMSFSWTRRKKNVHQMRLCKIALTTNLLLLADLGSALFPGMSNNRFNLPLQSVFLSAIHKEIMRYSGTIRNLAGTKLACVMRTKRAGRKTTARGVGGASTRRWVEGAREQAKNAG